MPPSLPPLNPLRAFEATARTGSLTKAASELNVTHGAVSHQIRALEQSLDVRLFKRTAGGLKLTKEGLAFLPAISTAFEGIASATALLTRPTSSGPLSVNCVPTLLSLWVLPRLGSFLEQYPEIALTFHASNDPRVLYAANVDVGLFYGNGNWTDCWVRKWTDVEINPVASPTLMNLRPIRNIEDLAGHVLLHSDDGREWRTWLAAAEATHMVPKGHIYVADARLAAEAALYGHGIALGDHISAAEFLATGRLVTPLNLSVPAADAFYVCCRNESRLAPVVSVFIDWLFAQNLRSFPGAP